MSKNELNDSPVSLKPATAPVTPYQLAQEEWDKRIGSARVQAKNWRITAIGTIGVAAIAVCGLIYQSSKTQVVPYVVQVNSEGIVQAAGPAKQMNYAPGENEIKFFLSQFVTSVRSLPLDPVVAKNSWLKAYQYLRQGAANTLNEIAQKEQPFSHIGQETVAVQVINVTAMSKDTYQVRWNETVYNREGVTIGSQSMTGLFSIEFQPPKDEKTLMVNPIGLYIKQFSWSKDV
ncbi:conjugal transfer protein TrbF [Geobacter grbiciae]|uniref:conjugal transfer protein TrbF n=1 Tax=Geobacter grbiciae TaxID=155042 RepID=UPI001C035E3E|nr:conjugal transfer protein TrbF [Geobacter grbiciae]MBT1077217.1 conjugal transfer protein TrbF [Geobacter grbiciae]